MSFRTEQKIVLSNSQSFEMRKILSQNNFTPLFSTRRIKSLYFDTQTLNCFWDSEEGVVPRKKIRLRTYDNIQFQLEVKTSSVEGRFKTVQSLTDDQYQSYISKGIYEATYGLLQSAVFVEYDREYFSNEFLRVTLDTNILYNDPSQGTNHLRDNRNIFEIKTPKLYLDDQIMSQFPFQRNRFSKYCEGIKALKL
jgi:hypothetical protein